MNRLTTKTYSYQSTIVNRPPSIFLFSILLIICNYSISAQDRISFPLHDDSYISYPMGENLVFEGQIAPDYPVVKWGHEKSKFSGHITITPKVLLKMYRVRSSPVKTPSYMPKITFQGTWRNESFNLYPFLILGHHSNGQGGETFTENNSMDGKPAHHGTLPNTESGSFATNFIQLGYFFSIPAFDKHFLGISYEHHPVHGWWFGIDPAIEGLYSRKRLHYSYEYQGDNLQIDLNYTDLADKHEGVRGGIVSATAKVKSPVFKKSMWFFASYYQGQDYYNIYFMNNIRQFKTGIAIQTRLTIN